MPVWFVSWLELEAVIADDNLTIGELAELPSVASFYTETLHPSNATQQTKTTIVAFGYLEDGRAFVYEATEMHDILRHVRTLFN